MLKVGLVGIGFMGRGHLDNYIRLEKEGFPIKLVAICDIDKNKFEGRFVEGNIDVGNGLYDFSQYNLYTNMEEMFKNEELDCVDLVIPSYLHAEASIQALEKGIHVFCEKPMALNSKDCEKMVESSKINDKVLMIGQCLRFWPEYEYLKGCVEKKKYGNTLGGYFFRGGVTPKWSYENWYLKKDKSGGCLFDQHVHDIDTINWLFGKPGSVSTIARNVIEGSGYDIVSTNYLYDDGKIINSQDDWTLNGEYGFEMSFRVNFEKGNLVYEKGVLKVNPNNDKAFIPEVSKDNGYYREIKSFYQSIMENSREKLICPESTLQTIKIAEAECISASSQGKFIMVK